MTTRTLKIITGAIKAGADAHGLDLRGFAPSLAKRVLGQLLAEGLLIPERVAIQEQARRAALIECAEIAEREAAVAESHSAAAGERASWEQEDGRDADAESMRLVETRGDAQAAALRFLAARYRQMAEGE